MIGYRFPDIQVSVPSFISTSGGGWTSQVALVVKNPPANAGDLGLIPGQENPLEEGMATHSSILAWRIPMDRVHMDGQQKHKKVLNVMSHLLEWLL